MVNNSNIRLLVLPLAPPNPKYLKIRGGPIYSIGLVQQQIREQLDAGNRAFWVGNESANESFVNDFFPPWEEDEIVPLLMALTADDRTGSEWAKTSNNQWFDCDVYVIGYNRNRRVSSSFIFWWYFLMGET